jgi:elongation factor P
MGISANDVRVGNILSYKGKLWAVAKISHTQPGKGGAYVQVEMKEITEGTKINVRFRSNETVEKAFLEQIEYQFLYKEGDNLILMNQETYEQITISSTLVAGNLPFLQEGMIVNVQFYEEKVASIKLPDTVEQIIEECESVVKGQTVSSSYKPAVLNNGVRVMVPQFIEIGDKIVVKIENREYVSRTK